MRDYAKKENRERWLRHPVLGDPSFDSFVRTGTVHRSAPPFDWAVNGSLFRDFDGVWYVYAGLYPEGYKIMDDAPSHFIVYRSRDCGISWENLGPGFEKGFFFKGHRVASDHFPDAVLAYDEKRGKYLLTYDWGTNTNTWESAHKGAADSDSGSAIAWAESPAGPFTRDETPYISNNALRGRLGRFSRLYAATVLPRKNDYISLALCDSGEYFAWGLACLTARDPEGEWSSPELVLSVDRDGYHPPLLEFYPCFVVGDTVYAPATSVAKNRNYQCVFAAELEKAHIPSEWKIVCDGSFWHSRPIDEEHYGIWGQTVSGFVKGGVFNVMYPSRDPHGRGVISTASRSWGEPFSDGFTLSGHGAPSVTATLRAYGDFSVDAEFELTGTAELAFDFQGVLGPDRVSSDSSPDFSGLFYNAVRIEKNRLSLISVNAGGTRELCSLAVQKDISSLDIRRKSGGVTVRTDNGTELCADMPAAFKPRPIALIAHSFSVFTCSKLSVYGEERGFSIEFNAREAILGAGQREKDFEKHTSGAYIGHEGTYVKWNVYCRGFEINAPAPSGLGAAEVFIDGKKAGEIDYKNAERDTPGVVFSSRELAYGRYGVSIRPKSGSYAFYSLTARY